MLQLNSIREKLTWQTVLIVALYVMAAAVFLGRFLPVKSQTAGLDTELRHLADTEQQLLRVVEHKSTYENRLQELEDNLRTLAQTVPSQYNFSYVLRAVEELSAEYGFTIHTLEHIPIRVSQDGRTGVFPLTLELEVDDRVPAYLSHLQRAFPSLSLDLVSLTYLGENRFGLVVDGELHVVMAAPGDEQTWQLPQVAEVEAAQLPVQAFGVAFERVGTFLNGGFRVLGIVETGSERTALVSHAGAKSWVRVGDQLGSAVIRGISPTTVVLDVDGVQLELTIGG